MIAYVIFKKTDFHHKRIISVNRFLGLRNLVTNLKLDIFQGSHYGISAPEFFCLVLAETKKEPLRLHPIAGILEA